MEKDEKKHEDKRKFPCVTWSSSECSAPCPLCQRQEKRSPFLLLAYHQIPSTSIITSLLSNLLSLPSAACGPRNRAQKKTTESREASFDLTVHLCVQRRMQRVSNLAKRDSKPDISTAPHFGKREERNLLGPPVRRIE